MTTGDPAGVGPEVALRALLESDIRERMRPLLIGDQVVLRKTAELLNLDVNFRFYKSHELAGVVVSDQPGKNVVEVLDLSLLTEPLPLSIPSPEGGRASYQYILTAIEAAIEGLVSGVVTAPINKLSLKLANVDWIGHTEIFGEKTETESYAMLMYSDKIAVGLVTCHQNLASVPTALNQERIVQVGTLLNQSLKKLGKPDPKIAVLGLNPHAGEAGLLGNEETLTISPAVQALEKTGVNCEGPIPPDTAFTVSAREKYDGFLCMYHDQGLIPFKMISFEDGVNVTMGLPFPRTSVDHGTAYDIAGRGIASITSMVNAMELCHQLSN